MSVSFVRVDDRMIQLIKVRRERKLSFGHMRTGKRNARKF